MAESAGFKRVSCRRRHPNRHLLEMLESLYRDAVKNRKAIVPSLKEAISSLEKYPLPLKSIAKCSILQGFTKKLCRYIDLHYKKQRNNKAKNRKTKVCDHGASSDKKVKKPKVSPPVEKISHSEITSTTTKKTRKIKKLHTNIESCTFKSKVGECSQPRTVNNDVLIINLTDCNSKIKKLQTDTENRPFQSNVDECSQPRTDNNDMPIINLTDCNSKIKKLETNTENCQFQSKVGGECSQPKTANNDVPIINLTDCNSKIKKLETNTENCQFQSKVGGECSQPRTANNDMPIINLTDSDSKSDKHENLSAKNDKSIHQSEKNNNTSKIAHSRHTQDYSDPEKIVDVDTYVVNKNRKDDIYNNNKKESEDNFNILNLCDNWESFTNSRESRSRSKPIIPILHEPREMPDRSENQTTVSESKNEITAAEVNLTLKNEVHALLCCNDILYDTLPHMNCKSVSTAAEEYQSHFKKKAKQDAEEIEKISKRVYKMYKPAYRSGAYAILVALLEQYNECPYRECLTKDHLIQKAQKHSDQSFTNPEPKSNCTAWIHAINLIKKGMITEFNPVNKMYDVYSLTNKGRAVAMELFKENSPTVTVNDVIFHGQRNNRVPSLDDIPLQPSPPTSGDEVESPMFILMPPGTFDVVMLIDKREHFNRTLSNYTNTCKYEERSLAMGDFLWVARSKKTGQELVLPYIVERKRMDDLASSIKDGRFHEQKFRLKKCGLQNVMYLVETCQKKGQSSLPPSTLTQAVVNTSIIDKFIIVRTDSLDDTFKFLDALSRKICHDFMAICIEGTNKDTHGEELMTYEFFNKFSSKNKPLTVRDTFRKMLLQLKGLSVDKALAITNKYSTPALLMEAYKNCTSEDEGEKLLAKLKLSNSSHKVGPVVSKAVYQLFSQEI